MRLTRIKLVEYGPSMPLQHLAKSLAIDKASLRDQLSVAGDRIGRTLGLPTNPIRVGTDDVRVWDIAGLVRIGPQVELEVAPKFLGSSWVGWRQDFFFLSMLSRHGRLLTNERIGSSVGPKDDLATLVARAIISMFWENHRRPLRTYRHAGVRDFAIEGDVEPETLLLPDVDGYDQRVISFDRKNVFNAAIFAAAKAILPEVREPHTRRQLVRVGEFLAPQSPLQRVQHRRVPSRARRWQSLHDLSIDVLKGFGVSYDPATVTAPGFIMDTWRVWEDLLTTSLGLAWGSTRVVRQRSFALGKRTTFDEVGRPSTRTAWVTPDVTVSTGAGLLVDAKYKGRVGDLKSRIAEADLYEAVAFATATKCNKVALVYPAVPRSDVPPVTGTAKVFETVSVESKVVAGIEVEVRGISKLGALRRFADGLRACLGLFAEFPKEAA